MHPIAMSRWRATRRLRVLLMLVLPLVLLACGDGADDDAPGSVTSIRFWHFQSEPGQRKALQERIAQFEKENPSFKVDLQELTWGEGKAKLLAAFSSGTAPDVVELGSDWVAQFSAAGVLADQKEMPGDSIGRFSDVLSAPGRWKTGIYAWPWVADTRVLFVNTGMLASVGLDTTARDTLWTDVILRAERLVKPPDRYGFGANGSDQHRLYKKILPFFWSNNGDVLDADGRPVINSTQNVAALETYLSLARAGFIDNQKGLDQMFVAGKIGYWISGPWLVERITRESPSLRYRVEPLPGFPGATPYSFAGGEYLAINAESRVKDAAKRLITFLTSPAQALAFAKALPGGTTPADHSVATDPFLQSQGRKVFTEQLRYARMTPVHPQWLEIEEIIEFEVASALTGEKDARAALDAAQVSIQQLLGLAPDEPAG